jgi:hypothetical protein
VQRDCILELLPLALVLDDLRLERALLLAQGLRPFLIFPEARLDALALDQIDPRSLPVDVKESPGARRSAA